MFEPNRSRCVTPRQGPADEVAASLALFVGIASMAKSALGRVFPDLQAKKMRRHPLTVDVDLWWLHRISACRVLETRPEAGGRGGRAFTRVCRIFAADPKHTNKSGWAERQFRRRTALALQPAPNWAAPGDISLLFEQIVRCDECRVGTAGWADVSLVMVLGESGRAGLGSELGGGLRLRLHLSLQPCAIACLMCRNGIFRSAPRIRHRSRILLCRRSLIETSLALGEYPCANGLLCFDGPGGSVCVIRKTASMHVSRVSKGTISAA